MGSKLAKNDLTTSTRVIDGVFAVGVRFAEAGALTAADPYAAPQQVRNRVLQCAHVSASAYRLIIALTTR